MSRIVFSSYSYPCSSSYSIFFSPFRDENIPRSDLPFNLRLRHEPHRFAVHVLQSIDEREIAYRGDANRDRSSRDGDNSTRLVTGDLHDHTRID